ncbi:hypothetical protein BcepF1.065 [Burkholderia phage BcepF1]|uniref:Uncharacterized protein n=1 Tax=Burkholderia phage BcepF1 TaxID=2886897 RepID=A1YZW9_9CAUD|nr:hypothetical protein BcepF1.065 [Burkholderia phage BcepF1]ABL96796.1 hypothetical protein BcepF1.065 [Burkholderia phage BcepF1]
MRIRFRTHADRVAAAEDQEKRDEWSRFFAIWPRETRAGEWQFFCWLERCPRVVKRVVLAGMPRAPGSDLQYRKNITWRYRAPEVKK